MDIIWGGLLVVALIALVYIPVAHVVKGWFSSK